ncbi:disease resistance protein RUN1-like [Carya illinoinensis]|uniref:disease resistance protein RUN1-like n=1 Tax=Carya illinoinensis TaxID=32201 RepID=UPI001C71A263|nr:disease resistance protein RUN1-like [Carya illinoinensis]
MNDVISLVGIFGTSGIGKKLDINDVVKGANVIWHRLQSKRILLILDDVDDLVQLEKLAGDRSWFGSESRVIVRTLDDNEALQLISLYAFKKNEPLEDYVDLSKQVIKYARGLPLTLTVLGSDLQGRNIHQWKSALDKYKKIPHREIQRVLQISYDSLEVSEKDMFLDIAFFFKGEPLAKVMEIFDSCGFSPILGIQRLMEKCLIYTFNYEYFWMHDLLQDMGQEIVREKSAKDLSKRSRFWFHEDIHQVFEEDMNLMIMTFYGCKLLKNILDLSSVSNLKELIVQYCKRLVEVHDSVGSLKNLSRLDFDGCSKLQILPRSLKLRSLCELNLGSCSSLRDFPEIECKMECLRKLSLYSIAVEELPLSIRNLIGLETLDLLDCKNLMRLPIASIPLKYLRCFCMGGHDSVDLPNDSTTMEDEISNSRNGSTALQPLWIRYLYRDLKLLAFPRASKSLLH